MNQMKNNFSYSTAYLLPIWLILSCLPASLFASPPEIIPLYTYHTHPPFILDKQKGLSYDLADLFSLHSEKQYRFEVRPMSRPRINKILAESRRGVIPWVNPIWFKDKDEIHYLWNRFNLFSDSNSVISHQLDPINYNGSTSIHGRRFGGVRGHNYKGLMYQRDQIVRVDSANHLDNIRKLKKRRIHLTIMPESAANYLIAAEGVEDQLYLSPTPHSRYQRRMLVIDNDVKLQRALDRIISSSEDEWLTILTKYR